VSANTTHWTLRGLDNQLLRDFKQVGGVWSVERDYVYRDGLLLAALKPGGAVEHYTLDHLGTPRLVTDGAGHKIGYHVYWPFGEEWSAGSAQEASPLKFTGHERDADPSGSTAPLDYMHARFYGAGWGRFLSFDPAAQSADPRRPQSWNRYAYVENHPLNLADPDGQCPSCIEAVLEEMGADAAVDYALGTVAALIGLESGAQASEADAENKPTGDEAPPLGATGQQVDSKTLWPPRNPSKDEPRVDVENPKPGERPGQVHIQKGKEKYVLQRTVDENHNWQYQFRNDKTGGQPPGWVKNLLKNPDVRDAILKGMQRYLNERGFNFSKLVR
jgi:RHS repeat-associated protein